MTGFLATSFPMPYARRLAVGVLDPVVIRLAGGLLGPSVRDLVPGEPSRSRRASIAFLA